jgi:hypothetical protein
MFRRMDGGLLTMNYNPGLQRRTSYPTGASPPVTAPTTTTASPIVITQSGHSFAVGDVVYGAVGSGFAKAQNNNVATLGRYVISAITANTFNLARPGDVVSGYAGLTPFEYYHTSPTVAGGLAPSGTGQVPIGCVAANPMGQAINGTDLLVQYSIPYEG